VKFVFHNGSLKKQDLGWKKNEKIYGLSDIVTLVKWNKSVAYCVTLFHWEKPMANWLDTLTKWDESVVCMITLLHWKMLETKLLSHLFFFFFNDGGIPSR
jgi:hypothetical protein